MSTSMALVVTAVLTLAFAIVYSERRIAKARNESLVRDECLRYALLLAAHRSGDTHIVELLESYGAEGDTVMTEARRDAFELAREDSGSASASGSGHSAGKVA